MQVLLLGFSSIAQRRVLPALSKMEGVNRVDIASRSRALPEQWEKQGNGYDDYQHAIGDSNAELLYISLPNARHLPWILAGLRAGKHVVVDKPATLSVAEAEACLEEASGRALLIAEATVFAHHSQIAAIQKLVAEHGPLTHIDAHFIIPPRLPGDFRTKRVLGGGCLYDMGPYAAAVSRVFGGGSESEIFALGTARSADAEVDLGFSLLALLRNGARLTGHFSFEGEYQNRLMLISRTAYVSVDRIFSPPSDYEPVLEIRRNGSGDHIRLAPCDSFLAFMEAVQTAFSAGAYGQFYDDLLSDATFRERLARALNHGDHPK